MNLSTMERLDSQLDQQLMHTPRSHCEVLATFLVDPGVLLFDRSAMNPAGSYMFKVNNGVSKWRRSGIFIVNFEHIAHLVLVFLLLTLSR